MQIDAFNFNILNRVDGVSRQYIVAGSLKELEELNCKMTEPQAVLDWVAQRAFSDLPPHTLTIKVNGLYCLLHNFSLDCRLVKHNDDDHNDTPPLQKHIYIYIFLCSVHREYIIACRLLGIIKT